MVTSVLVLVVSTALFFFFVQAFCEKVLKQEFSHPYLQKVIELIRLEYPRLRDSVVSGGSVDYADARLALKCDFITLEYLLKAGEPGRRHLSWREKVLVSYFRFLLYSLPVRHAFKLRENEAMLKLAAMLQFFANSVGERLSVDSFGVAPSDLRS